MRQKPTEKISKKKKDSSNNQKSNFSKDTNIIETTYEKVLSIINKVKDFIKKNSKNCQKLIDDLEWVIKVIANKSLYSYEIKKQNLSRQNSDYNKFINFVTKYNEEVIEMNQRHILVSGLLNLVQKDEILNKPSLCLKKILPEELKNMDYQKEKEKINRKKNIINLIGNAILNIYYKAIEKQEKEKEEKEKNKELKKNNDTEIIVKLNNIKKEKEKLIEENINNIHKEEAIKSNNINRKDNDLKKLKKNKIANYRNSYSTGKRKHISSQNLTKKEKYNLNNIKLSTENYYNKINANNPNERNNLNTVKQYKTKGNITKIKSKTNNNCQKNRNGSLEKTNILTRKNKNEEYENNKCNNKSFELRTSNNKFINHKIKKTNNLDLKNKPESINRSYIVGRHSNTLVNKKTQNLPNKKNKNVISKTVTEKIPKKEKNILENKDGKNIDKVKNENNKQEKIITSIEKEKLNLKILIDQHFNDMKMIIDKDFDIFDFKSKVGYNNVLPLMCHCILRTLGLIDNRIITTSKLEPFLLSINDNYKKSTLYHNSLHGADVTQSLCVFFINTNAEQVCETSILDLLGMIISAMGHDLGHPGLTNNFHINASTDLALTYNDSSCLENYHCSFLFKILKKDETNIFEKLNVKNYKNIRKRMISQILATDMANHGEVMSLIRTRIKLFQEEKNENENLKEFILFSGNEKTRFDEQQVLLNYLIHMADLGHNCKKYEISKQWIKLLCEEFWIQGDKEKNLGIPVSFLCDRDKIDVPASQVNFLRGFIISSFDSLVDIFPNLKFTMDNAKNNINEWQKLLLEKRKTGWTPKKEIKEKEEED